MNAVIFDMDGTLFQTNKILEQSLDDTFGYLRGLGVWRTKTPINKYREIMGVPLPTVWKILLPDQTEDIRKKTDAIFLEQLIKNISFGRGSLYPNAIKTLEFIKKNNYFIFIASNGLQQYLNTIVSHYNLDSFITETYSIEQIESLNKGDLVNIIKQNYKLTNAVVVGDRLSDIIAAKDNGFFSIGCNFDFAKLDELEQADFIIEDLIELRKVIQDIFG